MSRISYRIRGRLDQPLRLPAFSSNNMLSVVVLLCWMDLSMTVSRCSVVEAFSQRSLFPYPHSVHVKPLSFQRLVLFSALKDETDSSTLEKEFSVDIINEIPVVDVIPRLSPSTGLLLCTSVEEEASTEINVEKEPDRQLGLWAARGLLLLVAAIWGTNFASVKYLENLCFHPPCHHPPSEAAFARFGLAASVSIPLLFRQRWDVIWAGLECGLWISLGYFTQALALSTIDSGQCAFICSLTVVFVPVAAAVLYGKPVRPYNIVAALVALAGVGVLEGMVNVNELFGIAPALAAANTATDAMSSVVQQPSVVANTLAEVSTGPLTAIANNLGINQGDILALGQPIGFGTAFLRIEHYQEQFKDVPNRVLTIAAAQCVAVGILAFFWVLYDFQGSIPDFSYMIEPHRIAAIGWTGVVTTVVAIFIEGIALQKASATDASLAFSTEPVWASLFGFILLHETLGINSYVGGALILTACLIGAIADLKASRITESIVPSGTDDLLKP